MNDTLRFLGKLLGRPITVNAIIAFAPELVVQRTCDSKGRAILPFTWKPLATRELAFSRSVVELVLSVQRKSLKQKKDHPRRAMLVNKLQLAKPYDFTFGPISSLAISQFVMCDGNAKSDKLGAMVDHIAKVDDPKVHLEMLKDCVAEMKNANNAIVKTLSNLLTSTR